jgi:hypothetical protein
MRNQSESFFYGGPSLAYRTPPIYNQISIKNHFLLTKLTHIEAQYFHSEIGINKFRNISKV